MAVAAVWAKQPALVGRLANQEMARWVPRVGPLLGLRRALVGCTNGSLLETHGRQDSGYILMIVIPDPAPAVDMLLAWPFL